MATGSGSGDSAEDAREGLDDLAELLAAAGDGERPTPVELAELLWLARRMTGGETDAAPDPGPGAEEPGPGETSSGAPSAPAAAARPPSSAPPSPDEPGPRPDDRVPLRLPAASPTAGRAGPAGAHTSFLAPAPPMLARPLALQRALRPLKRRVPAPVGQELDEVATAHRIARLGAAPEWWLPVLRPATERWLTLHLVYDSGPTMPVWRPLIRELRATLGQSGVFRTVRTHLLTADGTVRRRGVHEAYGRAATLVLSDCMGPQWREGPAGTRWYGTLRRWAARMPVAVVQPLPERLWRTTALPAATARLAAPAPAVANSAYGVDSYALDVAAPDTLPVPVLEPSAPWLANWSKLVAGGTQVTGSVALLDSAPPPAPVDDLGRGDVERLLAEDLVLRFRALASPEAFRLAGHLAVGRPELPVMRLVQAAIEPHPQPQHLAEVILSGVLTAVPGRPGTYAFRRGVRELLLRTLPRTAHARLSELLGRVGALIDSRAGVTAGEFPATAPVTGPGAASAEGDPFAIVRRESLERLGGSGPEKAASEDDVAPPAGEPTSARPAAGAPASDRSAPHSPTPDVSPDGGPRRADGRLILGRYRLVRELGRGARVWRAEDSRTGRPVVVHHYDIAPDRHGQFLETARFHTEIDDPHVITVQDYGIEDGVPYLVREFVEGFSLAELTADGGSPLPYWILAPLARDALRGLTTVHSRSLAHGRIAPDNIVVRPDGTFAVTRFTLGKVRKGTEAVDLRDLGRLLMELGGAGFAYGKDLNAFVRAPWPLHPRVLDALARLTSPDLGTQRRARDELLSPQLGDALDVAGADRPRYRLLGPVQVTHKDRALPDLPPEQQALLCLLLLGRGTPVPDAELARGLWGNRPPERATPLLAEYAAGLRRALGPGTVATTTDGYAAFVPPGTLDVHRFETLAAEATTLRDDGDPAAARDTAQRALDLWQATPLDGVPGPAAGSARTRLRSRRLTLCALRAELDLELGEFDRAATDLAELLDENPRQTTFRRLYEQAVRELRARPQAGPATVLMEVAGPPTAPGAYRLRTHVLPRLLTLSGLASVTRVTLDDGFVLRLGSGAPVLSLLDVTLRELPLMLREFEDPPGLRITFWTGRSVHGDPRTVPSDVREALRKVSPGEVSAGVVIGLSPALHQQYTDSRPPGGPVVFQPVPHREPRARPIAWYRRLEARHRAPGRDLVHGPFTTDDITRIRVPEHGSTALVHTRPDGSLTLHNPDRPHGRRPSRSPTTYYKVDLAPRRSHHELALPSAGGGAFTAVVDLSWHVDDPVAFVRGDTTDVSALLRGHLVTEAGLVTRRHPLRRAQAAQEAVHEALRRWPVPGVSVVCSLRLGPETEPTEV